MKDRSFCSKVLQKTFMKEHAREGYLSLNSMLVKRFKLKLSSSSYDFL